jgi:hypothetical protein
LNIFSSQIVGLLTLQEIKVQDYRSEAIASSTLVRTIDELKRLQENSSQDERKDLQLKVHTLFTKIFLCRMKNCW